MQKIAFISQPEYFRFIYEDDLDSFAEVREFPLTFSMGTPQFQDLLDYNADFNIFFRGEFIPNDVLQKLNGVTINLSSEPFPRVIDSTIKYTRDSLNRYCNFREIREKSFDYVFHYDLASLGLMRKDGLEISGEFAFPVATDTYRLMETEEKWDLFFVGRSTQRRENLFGPLKHHYDFLHIAHGIWGDDVVKYICASRICLNVHAEEEISWEPRLQMMLACGAFVISEPITPNPILRPGIDFIEVNDRKELIEKVEYYLKHDDERNRISRNGYLRVKNLLESKTVFKNMLDKIERGEYPKFSSTSGSLFWDVYSKMRLFWRRIKRR